MVPRKRWTHIRVPVELAERINRLASEMERAYAEGRLDVPSEFAEHIPAWWIVASALDHQQAKRARSRRPRSRQIPIIAGQSPQEVQP